MIAIPLQRVNISNFRRLKGELEISLDAPIVLIHGPNGSGKTSVLSAIEFALTGEIRSMRRQGIDYFKHLPHWGTSLATVQMEIVDRDGEILSSPPITVGGDGVEGDRVLEPDEAQYFSERAFLDQSSLSRLFDLYLHTEGNEESSLARFVNELLGLEQLDALRSGLHDTRDVRRIRNLSVAYAAAEKDAARAASSHEEATSELKEANAKLAEARTQLQEALTTLGFGSLASNSDTDLDEIKMVLANEEQGADLAGARKLFEEVVELGGRIRGIGTRPTTERLKGTRDLAASTAAAEEDWRATYGVAVSTLRSDIAARGFKSGQGVSELEFLTGEADALRARVDRHASAISQMEGLTGRANSLKGLLADMNTAIAQAEERAGSLATGLSALRNQISDNLCPVCDRDFSEISGDHLQDHIDHKIESLADQGAELQTLSNQRAELMTSLNVAESEKATLEAAILSDSEQKAAFTDIDAVASLRQRFDELSEAISKEVELRRDAEKARTDLEDFEANEIATQAVIAELVALASLLELSKPSQDELPEQSWARLHEMATRRLENLEERIASLSSANDLLDRLREATGRVAKLNSIVVDTAQTQLALDLALAEATRRRGIARDVYDAAANTRTAIVERVFTQSLNDVWGDVFKRLAPSEPFVPAFGIPTAERAALKLSLETVHKSGGISGTPSMMLSTGNLNTAALSMFMALHLAVDPLIPCLVFDDPVQSMDEVHVSQFAGLLRVLSKHHGRQIVVAVHERELFEYLTLELSPAFEGDELITVELGLGSDDSVEFSDERYKWTDDAAIAV